MKVWQFIKDNMKKNSKQVICENEKTMTFEEVICQAEETSKRLNGIGCCAILCDSEMMAATALLSCFAAGVTALPLSVRYGEIHCNKILDAISPDAVITDEGHVLRVTKCQTNNYIKPKHHPALIMCTSGTTGKPKGAMLSEENIISNVKDIAAYFAISEEDNILIARPLYHCAVLTGEFLTALIKGAMITFCSKNFNPPKLLELIKEKRVTTLCGTPTLFSMLARFKKDDECFLKNICISGECLGKELGKKIYESFSNCNIYHVYGLTEACPRVCYLPTKLFKDYPQYVGIPLNSVCVRIMDNNGEEVENGKSGTLWVKGENVMLGYYNDPQTTQKVLKNGWLCTGDIAIIDDTGLIKIKGRKDDLIIKAGMNIYPAEIEDALKLDDRVKEVLVYGFESQYGTQIGIKIVGDFNSNNDVAKMCFEHLSSFQLPSKIEIVDKLPKSASAKIIRRV